MLDEREIDAPMPTYVASGQIGPRDWSLSFELGPSSLQEFNPLPLLQHVLMEVPALRVRGGVIFTVLSELYTNALDHGVMGLSSVVKSTANGFTDYYRRRVEALSALVDGYVRFEFTSRASDSGGYLKIRVRDSGPGFDVVDPASRARKVDRRISRPRLEPAVSTVRFVDVSRRRQRRGSGIPMGWRWPGLIPMRLQSCVI